LNLNFDFFLEFQFQSCNFHVLLIVSFSKLTSL
jgi:hypothetical protein